MRRARARTRAWLLPGTALLGAASALGALAGSCGGGDETGDTSAATTATGEGGMGGEGQGGEGGEQGGEGGEASGGTGGEAGSGGSQGGGGPGGGGGEAGSGGSGGGAGGQGGEGGAPPDPTCEAYCDLVTANCQNANTQYKDLETCLLVCPAFALGAGTDKSGNTLGCRIYHANAAAADPPLHCAPAGPSGAGLCGENCEGLCTVVEHACKAPYDPYDSEQDCLTECAGYPDEVPFSIFETSGNTFACRMYHATAAAMAPAIHCSHVTAASEPCQ